MPAKFLVLKWEDIDKYLTEEQKENLKDVVASIFMGRSDEGKPHNYYWVVNQDEPYADLVRDLIFEHEGYIIDPREAG